MDWSDLGGKIAAMAPVLGTLLGGPAGSAVGVMLASAFGSDATPSAVSQAIALHPEAATALRKIESDERLGLQQLLTQHAANELAADTARLAAVNATMQTEAQSERWPSYSWRPFIGFNFGSYVLSLWLLPLFGKTPVTMSSDLVLAVGAILGVASWWRGRKQIGGEK
jgi:hypothetical protein